MYSFQFSRKMYKAKKKTTLAPCNAVQFIKQFPKNFLRPYGRVETLPDEELVFHRTNPESCEWYTRPNVAISELSETIEENLAKIRTTSSPVLSGEAKEAILENLVPLEEALKPFNARGGERHATKENVKTFLSLLYEKNKAMKKVLSGCFEIGGAMFLIATQLQVARMILSEPERYAAKIINAPKHQAFKQEKNVKALRKMLEKLCIEDETEGSAKNKSKKRKSLLEQLHSSDEEQAATEGDSDIQPPKKKKKKVSSKTESE